MCENVPILAGGKCHLNIVRQLGDKVAGTKELHARLFSLEWPPLSWSSHLIHCWLPFLRNEVIEHSQVEEEK